MNKARHFEWISQSLLHDWLGLVHSIVKSCVPCQVATPKPSLEPLQMTLLTNGPREQVSIDFCEVARHYVLVVIDGYSRFPEVEAVHSTSAKAEIPKLDRVWGTPRRKIRQWPCCCAKWRKS